MIRVVSTNITSPLGFTTEENYLAVKSGKSSLAVREHPWGIPERVCASLFTDAQWKALSVEGMTGFESLAVRSIREALQRTDMDVSSPRVVLIISSTKGNIEIMADGGEYVSLAESARRIASATGVTTSPVVVCNACISGASAQLLALRLLEAGRYDKAVVCGADCVGKFVVSGFSSLKALSQEPCRPFDIDRYGLNLGEAAATVIFSREEDGAGAAWALCGGSVRNDAYHISSPSKTAEGCSRAIRAAMEDGERPALVSVHGTATLYNDQMESVALCSTGMENVPAMALKGVYGHTLGAAGILETILSMCSADDGEALPSRGFSSLGVSGRISISGEAQPLRGSSFLKIISGFGGCNAALRFSKNTEGNGERKELPSVTTAHRVNITQDGVIVDGETLAMQQRGEAMLTELYRSCVGDYPKFHKMDVLSKLAFISSELLLKAEGKTPQETEERAVILFNASSSIVADKLFLSTIEDGNYYPSPSHFVYTLPNISTGEIAIRNGYHGETSFYILPEKSDRQMDNIAECAFADESVRSVICGWIDCPDAEHFESELCIKTR